jgi:hypothetical protein
VTDERGRLLRDAGQVAVGERIAARLARGRLEAAVIACEPCVDEGVDAGVVER